ncbi:MAG: hypothetical protein AAGL90_00095 [Pseudomonadota bacterium]
MAKTSAREKLQADKHLKKVTMDKRWAGFQPGETMLVATPLMVDAYIREIPYGQTQTIQNLRDDLAAREACTGTCPMSTSIFVRMVAEAALEDLAEGAPLSTVSPFWRVISSNDKIAHRLKLDPAWLDERRRLEASEARD